ncbi:hypothetical protein ACS0TY_000796 [Phlomoides rotata]
MAEEHRYVSLTDLLLDPSMADRRQMSTPVPGVEAALILDPRKKMKKKSSASDLRHMKSSPLAVGGKQSRSDEPLLYEKAGGEAYDELEVLSKEMKKMWWEEMALKSN